MTNRLNWQLSESRQRPAENENLASTTDLKLGCCLLWWSSRKPIGYVLGHIVEIILVGLNHDIDRSNYPSAKMTSSRHVDTKEKVKEGMVKYTENENGPHVSFIVLV